LALEKIAKTIDLDLSSVPKSKHSEVKKEVGDFVKDEILRSLSVGESPVEGETFKKLDKEYADEHKGGNRTPNLELDGDLLDALTYKPTDSGLEIGIFKSSELGKADGHNKWQRANNNRIPKRRFIPRDSQKFDKSIRSGIKDIVDEYKEETRKPFESIFSIEESPERVEIQVGDLFNDDFLESFLRDEGLI
jgi:hypothetical protein